MSWGPPDLARVSRVSTPCSRMNLTGAFVPSLLSVDKTTSCVGTTCQDANSPVTDRRIG